MNFAPADGLYYAYSLTALPATTTCGNPAGDLTLYTFTANGNLDADAIESTFQLEAGTNNDNVLYRAPAIEQISALE
jgi:hypothetical protein